MRVTVILCTFNRCQILPRALESVAASRLPGSIEWEVLVVDNNSRDATPRVVEDFCSRYPARFRYLYEPQPGRSYALNAGIREARGDILAFMDDDVTVEPTWLRNLTECLDKGEWAGSGGRTLAAQRVALPRWLALDGPYGMGGILGALFDLGDKPCELTQAPFGTNMAFRKEMFEKHGSFRTDLGYRPGIQIPNEDTEFGRRLIAAGERLRYEPSAIVYHPIPVERLRKDYILPWHFHLGRAEVREIGRRPDIWGIPRPCLTMLKAILLTAPARTLRWVFALNPQHRFYCRARVWEEAGGIAEIYRRWFSKRAARETNRPRKDSSEHDTTLRSIRRR
jgi:glucosyl-dolichyl phosphate glucuronosyltransferase